MKAIIQAGGKGTRLHPVTREIPKPLLPVRQKPIISHIVDFLRRHDVNDIAVIASKNHEKNFRDWQKQMGDAGIEVTLFIEPKPSGTFGWVRELKSWLQNEPFLLVNGDTLLDFNLRDLVSFHNERNALATVGLLRVENPKDAGVPVLEGDRIKEFLEKPEHPPTNFVSSGLYAFHPDVFLYDMPNEDFVMVEHHLFPRLASAGKLFGFQAPHGLLFDCGTLERWERAMNEWPYA